MMVVCCKVAPLGVMLMDASRKVEPLWCHDDGCVCRKVTLFGVVVVHTCRTVAPRMTDACCKAVNARRKVEPLWCPDD